MSPRLALTTLVATLALAVAAPALAINDAADDARDAIRLQAARANAGEPVKKVRFLRPVDSYEVVGDTSILVWETNFKAWLVEVRPNESCQARHLDRDASIGLEASYDTLNTSNGYFVGRDGMRCRIIEIREVDVSAMRAAERGTETTTEG